MSNMTPFTPERPKPDNKDVRLTNFIERPGGEVIVGFALMGVGAGFYLLTIPQGEAVIVAGFTLISRAMVGLARESTK